MSGTMRARSRPRSVTQFVAVAAIKTPAGEVFSLPQPARHGDIIKDMVENHGFEVVGGDCRQGFIDNYGNFVSCEKAAQIAVGVGQVKASDMTVPGKLFSEDLW